jgi:hypothetical protein
MRNRNRDLSACSIVPQPTTLPRAPHNISVYIYIHTHKYTNICIGFVTVRYIIVITQYQVTIATTVEC